MVTIKLEKNLEEQLPGVTICYDHLFSFEKLAKYYTEFSDLFENYKKFYQRIVNLDTQNITNDDLGEANGYYNSMYKLYSIFADNVARYGWKLKYHDDFNLLIDEFGNDTIIMKIVSKNIIYKSKNPIKLFWFYSSWNRKCFTYFSSLVPQWRKFRVNSQSIDIKIHNSYNWFPLSHKINNGLSVHSPNMLPFQDNIYKQLEIGTSYVIFYRKVEAKLLPGGYDPHCINYDLDYKHGNFNMQSDCIYSCMIDRVDKNCIADIKTSMEILLRESQLETNDISECNGTNEIEQAEYYCYYQCPQECRRSYYILEAQMLGMKDKKEIFSKPVTEVYLRRSDFPDMIIEYMPEMSFISLVCNFGGLLGMWIGVSMFNIIIIIYKLAKVNLKKIINIINNYYYLKINVENITINDITSDSDSYSNYINPRRLFKITNLY